jgi:3-oxoacyl-[acyl-carrier protein] reductase
VLLLKADVSDSAAVGRMADEVVKKWGRLDVLVNNAGTTADALLIKLREEDWDRVLGTNLKGCFNTIRAFAGRILCLQGSASRAYGLCSGRAFGV